MELPASQCQSQRSLIQHRVSVKWERVSESNWQGHSSPVLSTCNSQSRGTETGRFLTRDNLLVFPISHVVWATQGSQSGLKGESSRGWNSNVVPSLVSHENSHWDEGLVISQKRLRTKGFSSLTELPFDSHMAYGWVPWVVWSLLFALSFCTKKGFQNLFLQRGGSVQQRVIE